MVFTCALVLLGGFLRALSLDWQPLWWDEGYSVYFATEPIDQMVRLTANDIHPPLYYGLLHWWIVRFGNAEPTVMRAFSVLIGVLTLPLFAWLAHTLFPQQHRTTLIALLLLALNPMHLYYSQEIRMYGLAMALGVVSTGFFWRIMDREGPNRSASVYSAHTAGYILATTLALYTLYYTALIFIAHLLWAIWVYRQRLSYLLRPLIAQGITALLFLPWVLYAGPALAAYTNEKVAADNDTPLGLMDYLYRHALTFTAGHVSPASVIRQVASYGGLLALGLLLWHVIVPFATRRLKSASASPSTLKRTQLAQRHSLLLTVLLLPTLLGFFQNLSLPFFPDGGERLLLMILPYALLLIAHAIDRHWHWRGGQLTLLLLGISAVTGIITFYTTPRHADRDYRPLIGQMVTQGRDADTLLAIFPWQVGYWRAYTPYADFTIAPDAAESVRHGPHARLVSDGTIEWGPTIAAHIDDGLTDGTLWFPAPMGLGSTLPGEIEGYIKQQPAILNVVERWTNPTTRLTAWRLMPIPDTAANVNAQWQTAQGPVQLVDAAATVDSAASANTVVGIRLTWVTANTSLTNVRATIRLQDERGHTWASRDLAPLNVDDAGQTRLGFTIPAGLAPGAYQFVVGIGELGTERLLPIVSDDGQPKTLLHLHSLTITAPAIPLIAARLPVQHPRSVPAAIDDVKLLGYAGPSQDDNILAGTPVELTLFYQAVSGNAPERHLYLSLLDQNGAGIAGAEEWPLPSYPTNQWTAGALVQVPTSFFIPATVTTGDYQLITGLLDPQTRIKSEPITLGTVKVQQRSATFTAPTVPTPSPWLTQFGTHVVLLGHDLQAEIVGDAATVDVYLYWQVRQPLLPPHHIFVHLNDEAGNTLAQSDSPPTLSDGDDAPTGSWQPDEYVATRHRISLPASSRWSTLRIGLYEPTTGQRLPVTIDGQTGGDAVEVAR